MLADIAAYVAGDKADVVSVTKPGAEIHGYQPTPQDIVRASGADLILWNGLNLELWFRQFFSKLNGVPSVVLSNGITPITISSGGSIGKPNPHAWMSLKNAMVYIDNIVAGFSKYDPDNATAYADNAARYKTHLRAALAPLHTRIAALPKHKRWLVTCEGAFSYLAQDLGLQELYLWPINAEQVGTPQQVRAVIDGIRAHNIPVVFCESTVNSAPARQVARETGARYGGVLYVDSLSKSRGPVPTYIDLLKVTTTTIANGLGAPSPP